MKEKMWLRSIYFICGGMFFCLVMTSAMEAVGMDLLSKLIMIAGICFGMVGLLLPVGGVIKKWEKEQKAEK